MRTPALAVLMALALIPAAAAHGAPETREIDMRVLADGTASGDYGGPEGTLSDGAPDLLVLDMREAADATGRPMLVFRFIHQLGDPSAGTIGIGLSFEAGGSTHTYSMETADGLQYTSASFERIDGPFDVGDGTPKAVEGWVALEDLGISTGASVSEIRATTSLDGTTADRMPGTYDVLGVTVPSIPPADDVPGTYAVVGPASLVDIQVSVNALEIGAQQTATMTIVNSLETMEQFATLAITSPAGVQASLDSDALALGPGDARDVTLAIEGRGEGEIAVRVQSDLGAFKTLVLPLIGAISIGDDSNVLSDDLANGASFQHTFSTVGTFDYHCHPHPWMIASITIEEPVNGTPATTHTVKIIEPDAADGQSWAFEPAHLTIRSGDTVAWVNEGGQVHVIMGGVAGDGHHASGGHGAPGHHGLESESTSNGLPGFEPLLLLAALGAALIARRI